MNTSNEDLKKEIIQSVKELSNNKFNQFDDLEFLITSAIDKNKVNVLEELSFNAKFSNGLIKILQRKDYTTDETYFSKVSSELNDIILKIKNGIEEITNGNDFMTNIFSEKYFQLTIGNLTSLHLLCSDLNYVKLYFNDKKNNREV